MSTRRTAPRRSERASRALVGTLLAGLALSVTTVPSTSASAALVGARPVLTPLAGAVEGAGPSSRGATGSSSASLADASAQPKKKSKKKRRFGPLRIGISTGFSILYAGDNRLAKDLARSENFGADQLRLDISWAIIEPEPGVYDWTLTDRLLGSTKAKGINVLGVIGFAPEWSHNPDRSVKPDLFAEFVDLAAQRYAGKVAAWEIWNEPNQTRSWLAKPDPRAYARLFEAASAPIRTHDPKAKILMGSLAPAVDDPDGIEISPITFLKGVYEAKIDRSSYDVVSVHPFSYPALPSGDEEWNTFNRLPDIYRVVKRNGDGKKPLWLTEYGARTGTSSRSVSLKRQTRLMIDAYRETKKLPFVQALFFYSLRDASPNVKEPEDNFGILKFNGRPKPAYKALRRELIRNP